MLDLFKIFVPDYDNLEKTVLITHADVDPCGLLPIFDNILIFKTAHCIKNEYEGRNGYREKNLLHKPYINICKILTLYQTVNLDKITAIWNDIETLTEPLTQIGFFDFEELHFEVYEGKGGHLPGEVVLIDYAKKIAIRGLCRKNSKKY